MKDFIIQALNIHLAETERGILPGEVWIYDVLKRNPHLSSECGYIVELRGHNRFQAAQAFLTLPDGSRYVQALGPKPTSANPQPICTIAIGKPRKLHAGCE